MGIWVLRIIMENPESHFDKRLYSLKDCVFLNSFKRVNWDEIILSLSTQTGVDITTDPTRWNLDTPGYSEIYKSWQIANFNPSAIKWTNYYPTTHFSEDITQSFAKYLRVDVHRSWISKVDPGYYSPWHWDVDDNEQAYLNKGVPKRYSIMMDRPAMGQIFILGKDYLYDCPQGSIFKWNNYKEWHAGINAGMTPKYMFHLLAY